MRGKAKWSLVLSIVLVLSLVLSACGGSKSSTKDSKGSSNELADKQEFSYTSSADIPSLNWSQVTDTTSSTVLGHVNAGLMRMDENMVPQPDMAAEAPKVSDDKKTYTFKIRDNAKWSDGSPVTADDFVYAWQTMVASKTASQYAFIFPAVNVKNAAQIEDKKSKLFDKVDQLGIKALDEKTLEVQLDKPTPYFLSSLANAAFFPAKKSFVEKQGKKFGQEANTLLFNGPFKLTSWKHGEGWTYEKNKDYWDAKNIHLTKVNVKVVKDTATTVNLYKTGKIDYAPLDSQFVDEYKNNKDEFHNILFAGTYWIRFNQKTVPAFKDVNVRKAFSMSIDRENLAKVLLNNGAVGANYIVPKGFAKDESGKDYRDKYPNGFNATDKAEAKKLWKKSGVKKLNLEFLTSDNDLAAKLTEYYANQISSNLPGVKITVNKQPWAQFLKLDTAGDYQMNTSGWSPDYLDPMTFLDLFTSDSVYNPFGYSDKEYDKLIEDAQNLGDKPAERFTKLQEAERILLEKDQAVAPTYQKGSSFVTKPYVKGFYRPSSGFEENFEHAKILKH
ncbi:peptide ABC transporter substrate-binding protein [Terrilactibacillus sp. BCM23-1]|uniref:Peptide ABC transporter substrate-binding protein n=1 Tax=Terrilactibacillus tamarindi TaxID=2599694 RepID=A0A6N8CL29_9BACI|nr:peptide ABC transporter substrate-binding protein [Terrilactibacillus tamarindi]MTT30564.1 peptide ABC transporter substrate-binding protein [Terrilactibacillus tamarindi]